MSSAILPNEPMQDYHTFRDPSVAMMTIPPSMHMPQCHQLVGPSEYLEDYQGAFREFMEGYQESHFLNFPQSTQISPMGTSAVNDQSNEYDERNRRTPDDTISSSHTPRSSPLRHFIFLRAFDSDSSLYPERSSPDLGQQLPSEETIQSTNNNYPHEPLWFNPVMSEKCHAELFGSSAGNDSFRPLTSGTVNPVARSGHSSASTIASSSTFAALTVPTPFIPPVDIAVLRHPNTEPFQADTFAGLPRAQAFHDRGLDPDWEFLRSMPLPRMAINQPHLRHHLQSPVALPTPSVSGSNYTPSPVDNDTRAFVVPTTSPPLRRASYATSGREVSQQILGSTRGEMVADSHQNAVSQLRLAEKTSGRPPGGGGRGGARPRPTRMISAVASTSTAVPNSSLVIRRTATKRLPIRPDCAVILESAFKDDSNTWRRIVLENIMRSSFFHDNEMEPEDQGHNDPITMGYGKEGQSIYSVFVQEEKKGEWNCLFRIDGKCATTFKRLERAIEHIRSHLDHRPYPCTGECNQGPTCQRRFYASQYLRDHRTRKGKAPCGICGRSVLVQNLNRHHQLRHHQLHHPVSQSETAG